MNVRNYPQFFKTDSRHWWHWWRQDSFSLWFWGKNTGIELKMAGILVCCQTVFFPQDLFVFMCLHVLTLQKKALDTLELEVADSYEPTCGVREWNPGPLQKQLNPWATSIAPDYSVKFPVMRNSSSLIDWYSRERELHASPFSSVAPSPNL